MLSLASALCPWDYFHSSFYIPNILITITITSRPTLTHTPASAPSYRRATDTATALCTLSKFKKNEKSRNKRVAKEGLQIVPTGLYHLLDLDPKGRNEVIPLCGNGNSRSQKGNRCHKCYCYLLPPPSSSSTAARPSLLVLLHPLVFSFLNQSRYD